MPGADRILAAKQIGKWGLITQEGQWVVFPDFDAIGLPNQDYFPGRRSPGIEWALFSFSGKELYPLPKGTVEVGSPCNRLRSFETLKGWGFFDGNGVQAIEPRFSLPAGSRRGSRLLEFVSDQAAVMIESGSSKGAYGSLWLGLIDYDGSWIVEPAPDFQAFGDGSLVIYPIKSLPIPRRSRRGTPKSPTEDHILFSQGGKAPLGSDLWLSFHILLARGHALFNNNL